MTHNKRYLILKACDGLGNRLFTLAAAIEYAKRTKRVLLVDWSDGQFEEEYFNVFYDYFKLVNLEHIQSIVEISEWDELSKYPSLWGKNPEKKVYSLYKVVQGGLWGNRLSLRRKKGRMNMLARHWVPIADLEKHVGLRKFFNALFSSRCFPLGGNLQDNINEDVIFYADFIPTFIEEDFSKHIQLSDSFENRIESIGKELGILGKENILGIHIRNTDKAPKASLENIFDKIRKHHLMDHRVFLATDNLDVKKYFQKKYPDLITSGAFLLENSKEGLHNWVRNNNKEGKIKRKILEESMIDMWLLSKCDFLLYQGNSSFSALSRILHKEKANCIDWQSLS